MQEELILYPMFALVGWVFLMTGIMLKRAFRAVGAGLDTEYFRYGSGAEPPGYMRSAYQHYSNLFEMPVLFYSAVLTSYVTGQTDRLLLWLAWAYVATRILHGIVHVRNKSVARRRDSFLLSAAVLIAIWALLLTRVASG